MTAGAIVAVVTLVLLALTILYAGVRWAIRVHDEHYFLKYGPATCRRCGSRAVYALDKHDRWVRLRCACRVGAPRRATKWE